MLAFEDVFVGRAIALIADWWGEAMGEAKVSRAASLAASRPGTGYAAGARAGR